MCCQTAAPARATRRVEIADLFRKFADELPALTHEQAKIVWGITNCRTAELGGHIQECDHCGHLEISYNSCRNRHCPKCQSLNQARWLEARQSELLPVEYFHVVFTIPDVLHPFFLANRKLCYKLLFDAVAETLREVALNPDRLGARIGFMAILHTWTQTLLFHPHVHCVVPGGGLDAQATRWVSCKPGFFLPVRILSTVFRGKLLSKLEEALNKDKLWMPEREPRPLLRRAARKQWMVYSKAPFAGPEQVLRYLGRYTHRIAISNDRLIDLDGRQLTFSWKDRADGNKRKPLTLDAVQFLRRFLLHVLPSGFMRIRYYGLLANSVKRKWIALCRTLLIAERKTDDYPTDPDQIHESWQELLLRLTGIDVTRCPECKKGRLIQIFATSRRWELPGRATSP